jgi:hypothetical protein
VLAAGPLNGSPGALTMMERLIELLEANVAATVANIAADTLLAYLTGFVLQEQMHGATAHPYPISLAELTERFPRVIRGAGADDDATFGTAITAIIKGFTP